MEDDGRYPANPLTVDKLIGTLSHYLHGFYRSQDVWTITIPWLPQHPWVFLTASCHWDAWQGSGHRFLLVEMWCIVLLGNSHHQDNIPCLGDRKSKQKIFKYVESSFGMRNFHLGFHGVAMSASGECYFKGQGSQHIPNCPKREELLKKPCMN